MMKTKKRKIIMHLVIIGVLCAAMTPVFYFVNNDSRFASYYYDTYSKDELRIYITPFDWYYHSEDCPYLGERRSAMGEQEAIGKGYTACSSCGGLSCDIITVKYTKKVEIERPKSIWAAIVTSVFFTPLMYIFYYAFIASIPEYV